LTANDIGLESAAVIRNKRGVPHLKMLAAATGLALMLAGCQSSHRKQTHVTRLPEPVTTKSPPPPSAKPAIPLAPARPPATALPANSWVPLAKWSQQQGFGLPERIGNSTNHWQLTTPGGNFAFQIGSRAAWWNGLQVWLGFAPGFTNGQVYVHTLDTQKHFNALLTTNNPPPRGQRLVVIDPGHGGDNLGAKSVLDGRHEKEFTLDWARRLKPLLEAAGWRVLLTRNSDIPLTLPERVTFAEQHHAQLFLSLHFNSATPAPEGLETYCITPAGMTSHLTRESDDNPSQVLPNNAFDEQNLQYAARLQRALLQATGAPDRGIRHARFMAVLRNQSRPAILIEGGYLSNATEARRIAAPEYRQKLAVAVAKALSE